MNLKDHESKGCPSLTDKQHVSGNRYPHFNNIGSSQENWLGEETW